VEAGERLQRRHPRTLRLRDLRRLLPRKRLNGAGSLNAILLLSLT
jgi:hypothetical protein